MPDLNIWPERSLLGALVMSPTARQSVAAVVALDDLRDPWHREVYATLIEHPGLDLVGVAHALQDRVGPLRADLPRLHDLVHDLPLSIDTDAWTRLVVDGALRRQIAQAAGLLRACATVEPIGREQVLAVTAALRRLAGGWAARIDRTSTAGQALLATPAMAHEHELLAVDRAVAGADLVDPAAARDVEVRFIGSLFTHRERIPPWAGHIRPEWLTAREWAPVLSALQRRAELGEVLDVVSVCWEAQRTPHPGVRWPGADAVNRAVEDWCWQDPDHLGRQVTHHLLRRAASNAVDSIRAAARNPGLTLPDLFHTVEVTLQAIEWAAEPLTHQPLPDADPAPPLELPAHDPVPAPPAIGW